MGEHWESIVDNARYSPRNPTQTDLYRVIYNYHEELEQRWDDLFYERYGYFRREVREAFMRYLDCGVVWRGCMRAECENCHHSILIAHSCKVRGVCPSCAAKRGVILAEHIEGEVLSGEPVRHIVFGIAKRLRYLFRDRTKLSLLFDAAWKTIGELCKSKSPYAHSGAILSVQTSGESLGFNPHIHGMLVSGYHNEDGGFVEFDDFSTADLEELTRKFAKRLLKKLVKLDLIEDYVAEDILVQEYTGCSVWIGDRIDASDTERIKFLTRYIERAPISLKKLSLEGETVRVHSSNEVVPDGEFSPLEFLARLSLQIPFSHECTLRYYGTLSYRRRGDKATEEKELTEEEKLLIIENSMSDLETKKKASPTWAECIRLTYEVDPLLCPKCGSNMVLKAAIKDEKEIQRLANHLGDYETFHPPPKLETFSAEIVYDDLAYV